MRIVLTGGTGFIGCHFINKAQKFGHEVVALRRPSGNAPRVPLVTEPRWIDKSLAGVTKEDIRGCDALVHLAAHSANVPYDTFQRCLHFNVIESLGLLATACDAGIRRVVCAGSCFEYGLSGERYEFIPPDAPLEPLQSYPASKAAASIAFRAFACEKKMELAILRIFQVFGEGEASSRFWPSLRQAALAGRDFPMTWGEQVRDFTPVDFVVDQFLGALERPIGCETPWIANVGTGQPQTLRAFAEHWWTFWEAKGKLQIGALPYRPNEVMRYVPRI